MLDLSCRLRAGDYWVVTDRWQKFSSLKVCESTLAALSGSCDEFLVHGVDVEGKCCGIDSQLIQLLGATSPIPVTYAGGVRDMVRKTISISISQNVILLMNSSAVFRSLTVLQLENVVPCFAFSLVDSIFVFLCRQILHKWQQPVKAKWM